MIHKIYSDLPTFKELSFEEGLNILLASRTSTSTEQQTRNGAGKSSLVELIHFTLGGKCKPDNIFRNKSLIEYSFGIDFDFADKRISIQRSGEKPSKLIVNSGDFSSWSFQPKQDKKSNDLSISNANWTELLGDKLFDVSQLSDEGDEENETNLSFRQLFSYFARKDSAGGFEDPFKFFSKQFPASIQACMFYFLGLDQFLPQRWNHIRDREKTIKELKLAMTNGLFKEIVQSTSDLRTQIALTEKKISDLEIQLKEYKVLPEYQKVEEEASKLILEISDYSNQDTVDLQLLQELEKSLKELPEPDMTQVENIYKDAGLIFPDFVTKRFEEVLEFHKSIYSNRKNYLENDIANLRNRITERNAKKLLTEQKYTQNMSLLKTHGALDTYVRLTSRRDENKLKLSQLKDQFDVAQSLETNKTRLESERSELLSLLVNEYKERATEINEAIIIFEDISSKLYEQAGSLHIGESLNGPTFEIKIQGEKSKGINNMQIFCLDMTIQILMNRHNIGPKFLIHDSHIFDGVDERQIAKALDLGKALAEEHDFQYIVTMNSDTFDGVLKNVANKTTTESCVLPVILTDEVDTGGLFGLRFN